MKMHSPPSAHQKEKSECHRFFSDSSFKIVLGKYDIRLVLLMNA